MNMTLTRLHMCFMTCCLLTGIGVADSSDKINQLLTHGFYEFDFDIHEPGYCVKRLDEATDMIIEMDFEDALSLSDTVLTPFWKGAVTGDLDMGADRYLPQGTLDESDPERFYEAICPLVDTFATKIKQILQDDLLADWYRDTLTDRCNPRLDRRKNNRMKFLWVWSEWKIIQGLRLKKKVSGNVLNAQLNGITDLANMIGEFSASIQTEHKDRDAWNWAPSLAIIKCIKYELNKNKEKYTRGRDYIVDYDGTLEWKDTLVMKTFGEKRKIPKDLPRGTLVEVKGCKTSIRKFIESCGDIKQSYLCTDGSYWNPSDPKTEFKMLKLPTENMRTPYYNIGDIVYRTHRKYNLITVSVTKIISSFHDEDPNNDNSLPFGSFEVEDALLHVSTIPNDNPRRRHNKLFKLTQPYLGRVPYKLDEEVEVWSNTLGTWVAARIMEIKAGRVVEIINFRVEYNSSKMGKWIRYDSRSDSLKRQSERIIRQPETHLVITKTQDTAQKTPELASDENCDSTGSEKNMYKGIPKDLPRGTLVRVKSLNIPTSILAYSEDDKLYYCESVMFTRGYKPHDLEIIELPTPQMHIPYQFNEDIEVYSISSKKWVAATVGKTVSYLHDNDPKMSCNGLPFGSFEVHYKDGRMKTVRNDKTLAKLVRRPIMTEKRKVPTSDWDAYRLETMEIIKQDNAKKLEKQKLEEQLKNRFRKF